MPIIGINVKDKRAAVEGTPVIVCGNADYTLQLTFDEEWEAATYKSARFVYVKNGQVLHQDATFTGETVAVPVLSDIDRVNVGFYAGELHTSTPAVIPCKASILCGSGEVAYPTPDEDARIMELLNVATDAAATATEASTTAQEAAETAASAVAKCATADNPVFTGSVSMSRKAGTTVGEHSTALGYNVTASAARAHAEGYTTTASGEQSHAEGNSTTASGRTSHAEGNNTTAEGTCSHAEGYKSKATAAYTHAEGQSTTASGDSSHAEGQSTTASNNRAHAEGFSTTASGISSHAEGESTTASGRSSHAGGIGTEALTNQYAIGHYNDPTVATENSDLGTSTGTAFVIGNGSYSGGTGLIRANAFRVTGEGETFAQAAYNATGADYAEYEEWADGNPDNEDRRGYFVTLDDDDPMMIRLAGSGDDVLGVVSGNPCIIGDADECWRDKYAHDEFGTVIYEDVEAEVEYINEETGETETRVETVRFYKVNPEYDPTRQYVHRRDRQEWAAVGRVGKLAVRDDGTCEPGGYCTCKDGGIATAATFGWRIRKRINENIVLIDFK